MNNSLDFLLVIRIYIYINPESQQAKLFTFIIHCNLIFMVNKKKKTLINYT